MPLVARPRDAPDADDRCPLLRPRARIEDAELEDLRPLEVGAHRHQRSVRAGRHRADARLAGGVERDRVEQQQVAAVDLGVELRLRLALERAQDEHAAVAELRRRAAVAVDDPRELVAQPRDRRRATVEERARGVVLRLRPLDDRRILAALQPAEFVGERDAVQRLDDGLRRRRRRRERALLRPQRGGGQHQGQGDNADGQRQAGQGAGQGHGVSDGDGRVAAAATNGVVGRRTEGVSRSEGPRIATGSAAGMDAEDPQRRVRGAEAVVDVDNDEPRRAARERRPERRPAAGADAVADRGRHGERPDRATSPASTLNSAPSIPATAITTRCAADLVDPLHQPPQSRPRRRRRPASPPRPRRRACARPRARPRASEVPPADDARCARAPRGAADRRGSPCATADRSRALARPRPASRANLRRPGASAAAGRSSSAACATIASICAAVLGSQSTASLVPVRCRAVPVERKSLQRRGAPVRKAAPRR